MDGSITNGYESRIKNGISVMQGQGLTPVFVAAVLNTGTNDSASPTAASFYKAATKALIARLRLIPELAGARFFIIQTKSGGTGLANVQTYQAEIVAEDPTVTLIPTAADAAITLSDSIHYTCPTAPRVYTGRARVGQLVLQAT